MLLPSHSNIIQSYNWTTDNNLSLNLYIIPATWSMIVILDRVRVERVQGIVVGTMVKEIVKQRITKEILNNS